MAAVGAKECDFVLTGDENIMLVFKGPEGAAKDPFLTLENRNGDFEALLMRDPASPLISLGTVPPSFCEKIRSSEQILVCETDADGEPQQIYDAAVLKSV